MPNMRKDSIAIINANIVNEGSIFQGDLLIKGGRIIKVEPSIHIPDGTQVIDAKGKYLLPGLIDDQVHFREPGLTHKGGIMSESSAAVAGGVTSFMDMPNVKPATTTRELLAQKYALAAGKAYANYAFYLGASNTNIDEIKQLQTGETCGVKVFMGSSTGNMLVDDSQALEDIFSQCPVLIATHCEDNPTIERNMAEARRRYPEGDIPVSEHPIIRSVEACYKSSSKAVMLAKKYDSKLHVLHLTSQKELGLFSTGDPCKKNVTAEVCVHHLHFDESYYESMGSKIVCNPAIKTSSDRNALMDAVRNGIIDVIATDHAPHTLEEKAKPYPDHPAGLPLVQHSLLALLDFYHKAELSLEVIVEKTSHALANIYGIKDRGFIREGYWADLVLVDVEKTTKVNTGNILYDCGWSPFEGHEFNSLIDKTFVNGELVYSDGQLITDPSGLKIEFV